jgi:hypothetical protein
MPTASPSAAPTTPSPDIECEEKLFPIGDTTYVFNECGSFTACSEGSIVSPPFPGPLGCAVYCTTTGGFFMATFNQEDGSCKCTTKEQYEESGVIVAAGQELYTVASEERSIQLSEQCSVAPTTSAPSSAPTAMPTASPSATPTTPSPSTSPENIVECEEVTAYFDDDGISSIYSFNDCGAFTTCSEGTIVSLDFPDIVYCAQACVDAGGYFMATFDPQGGSCKCTTKEQYEESGVIIGARQVLYTLTPEGSTIQLSEQCGEAPEGEEPEDAAEAV